MVAARTAIGFSLSPGQAGDAPERRNLLSRLPVPAEYLVMDRAYEGDKTRQCLVALGGLTPVAPPKSNRIDSWEYDRETYKKRNEVEALSQAQEIPANFHPLRQVGQGVHFLRLLRSHRRCFE